ncbi:18.6 kDa class III heat shock protein [Lolium perenne]|uniref:18.6 kDa class III heat shock protein n=1 Tax=Lolium perenne TaxID=4522 RepID=UPI0021F50EEB|nr:18.6 kDa class III heat shock protein [Lolium perenne]
MAELLFAPAVTGLLHLPEVLDLLAAADSDQRGNAHHHHAAHGHGQHRAHGVGAGGGAPVDIVETPGEYAFLLDVPGLSKSDIQVTLEEDNVLVMKSVNANGNGAGNPNGAGKRKRDDEEGDCKYIRLERRASPRSFVRKFRLPEDADAGGVTARCENGVLTVTVKKQPPQEKKPKSVQVAIA